MQIVPRCLGALLLARNFRTHQGASYSRGGASNKGGQQLRRPMQLIRLPIVTKLRTSLAVRFVPKADLATH
jgi:hypothetical protein